MPPETPQEHAARSTDQIVVEVAIRLGLLMLLVYLGVALVRPFAPLLLWSVILTVATYPIFTWLCARLNGRRRTAAALLTIVSLAIVFGPAAMLSTSLILSLERLAVGFADDQLQIPPAPAALAQLPVIGEGLQNAWTTATSHATAFVSTHADALLLPSEWLLRAVTELAGSVLVFAVSVVIAGFLFLSGPRLIQWLHDFAVRVIGPRGRGFIDLAGATIRNVARGIVGVSVLQALVIGIGLIVAGVSHAGLLTVATLILCIVQVGAMVVLVPLIAWFWMTQDAVPALLFTLYMVPAGLLDNALKPFVMGGGVSTPMLVILLGVASGTVVYGLLGLFIGPIVLAVLYELVTFWMSVQQPRDGEAPPP